MTTATATRRDGRWLVTVPGVGTAPARRADDLDDVAAALATSAGQPAPLVLVDRVETVDVAHELAAVNDARARATALDRAATDRARALAVTLVREHHLSMREAGRVLGVSGQRVQQLVSGAA